ncbi:flagellar biosynthetic protein FliR [Pararhizobium mangrovi]|uniref:Flagellar biosynthetic protein FliR n=1 Tax=Pararhizobium mangrovi TaxID=2590452 RepID=A0A506U2U9_9HYPH|nr:flagellar biosynthetic protein FliR [Pararhizobium mangrovi]TPW26909.1 flagellar type III secretion system protein FliR [Pararhizobium mangrovi]
MISDPQGTVLALFAAFCRIGACFMTLPGFGSLRVPMRVRALLALALSLAILPMVWSTVYPKVTADLGAGPSSYLRLVGSEVLIGATLGLVARYYVLALQFASVSVSMLIGFNSMSSLDIPEATPQTELATLINFVGLLLLFVLNFHAIVIRALVNSYDFMPLGQVFDPQMALSTLADTLSSAFMVILQLTSPFLVYSLVFNITIGMINKLAPQIPIYFISLPFIITGGLILFYYGSSEFFDVFVRQFPTVFLGQ